MKHLPLVLISSGGVVLLGTYLYNKRAAASPATLQGKVSDKIATSNDPSLLKQLASGLHKTGDPVSALAALQKAANLSGVPLSIPGLPPVTPTASLPTGGKATKYRVAPGDIPGAIAKRFSLGLAALAKAQGANQKRIMGGQIKQGELLNLPPEAIDTGVANRAKGIAS